MKEFVKSRMVKSKTGKDDTEMSEFEKRLLDMKPKFSFKFSFRELVNGYVHSVDSTDD